MKVRHCRIQKDVKWANATAFLAQDREIIEEAFAGDIIGIRNHGTIRIGDTFSEGKNILFTGIPSFSPEMFNRVDVKDRMKTKQLKKGLEQLAEEGAVQLFIPIERTDYILGAVGQLQLEVVKHRLAGEYHVDALLSGVDFSAARWLTGPEESLKKFTKRYRDQMLIDSHGFLVYITSSVWVLKRTAEDWKDIEFHATDEAARLEAQSSN
jgi:peptide chain release factor 3